MPHFIPLALVSLALWLLFPKSFKYLVGSWVGVAMGGCGWGLIFAGLFIAGVNPSWAVMGYGFITAMIAGIMGGCVLASRG